MMLEKLSDGLQSAVNRIIGAKRIDEALVNDVIRDIQRALLGADVSVKLVFELSNRIKKRAFEEKPPPGTTPKSHVLRIVYEELVGIVGNGLNIELKPQTLMLVGLQGSGKTTTTAKLARYFQKKGLKPFVICADTYRPAAYEQLSTLCEKIGVSFYGEKGEKDAVSIVRRGLKEGRKYDIKIIDTTGRHALEHELIEEMKKIHEIAQPEHTILVLDAAIGQGASEQARAFDEAVGVSGIIITKLDGTAKGGGALSAVSEIGSPIAFIGAGETLDDLEPFDPNRFISRVLGMGDIQTLLERAKEIKEIEPKKILSGQFTLKDFYEQLEAMEKLGPLKQVIQMLPLGGMGIKLSDEEYEMTKEKMDRFKVIMKSMTKKELENPRIIDSSRVLRIARGSGTSVEEVRNLLKYYKMMQKAMKGMGDRGKMARLMKRFGV